MGFRPRQRGGGCVSPHDMEMRAGASIHWLRLTVTWVIMNAATPGPRTLFTITVNTVEHQACLHPLMMISLDLLSSVFTPFLHASGNLLAPAAVVVGLGGGVVTGLVLWPGLVGVLAETIVKLKYYSLLGLCDSQECCDD